MTWKPDPVLRLLLGWTALTTLVFWLPFIRTLMDGPTYEWGLAGQGGRGLQGDVWLPVLGAAFALLIRYLGWRGAGLPFHALLLLWLVPLGALASWAALSNPDDFRFQGDSLGINIPLAWAGPAIFGGLALVAIVWVVRDLRSGRRPEVLPWAPANRAWTLALVGLLPIQFLLLRFGEPQSTTDQIGVILTIAQWLLVGFALKPRVAQ
jgi:hypothetical protein